MHYFFAPDIENKNYILPDEEAYHAIHVLRVAGGAQIGLLDGNGNIYHAVIKSVKKQVITEITEKQPVTIRTTYKHIAIAPTKQIDRFEWFVEKATELGIDRITPILTHFSERRVLNTARLKKIAIAAIKQSVNPFLPVIDELIPVEKFYNQEFKNFKCIAVCQQIDKSEFSEIAKRNQKITIMIGPEGDFSEKEINFAINSGFVPVSIGNYRYRTETAGIIACHTINLMNL